MGQEVVPFQVFHGDVGQILFFADIEDSDDVGVLETAGGLGFTQKSGAGVDEIVTLELAAQRHGLDGYLTVDLRVVAKIDHAHRAPADLAVDPVAAQRGAVGSER